MQANSLVRLFCFPAGGTGASQYRSWSKFLGENIKIVPVQFPGREERYADPLLTDVPSLVEDACKLLNGIPFRFAFFGHSLGALVSFELARELRRRQLPGPTVLFVSGYPGPHLTRDRPKISPLPKRQFLETLIADFDIATLDREFLDFAYPILRADFAAVETYSYKREEPLGCRIIAMGGQSDKEATEKQLFAWQEETSQPLTIQIFPGGHFYLDSSAGAVALLIRQELGL